MGNIRVIGPRASGKTTYLAALAYQPARASRKNQKFNIRPLNDDTRKLAEKAKNIILKGASLEPTNYHVRKIDDLPLYSLNIEIKKGFTKEQITLALRDYPGEIFEELKNGSSNPLHQEFIDECLTKDVSGCLILLTDWQYGTDEFYSEVLQHFIGLMRSHDRVKDLRLAVAMSKCERGELWPGRLDPEIDLFDVHLRQTKDILRKEIPANNLQFYAVSTFGVLGRNNPRPNQIYEWGTSGSLSGLRDSDRWQPYGLISPLYWLSTGKRMRYDA
jgi:hypothetical protein